MKQKMFLMGSLLAGLVACTPAPRESVQSYADFPQTQELKGEAIRLDTALFRYPYRVRMNNGKALVMDLHGTDHFAALFSHPEGKHLASFGKRGEAPEEMISAENARWEGDDVWTLDGSKSELTRWGWADGSMHRREVVKLEKDMLRALDFVQRDDSTFIIPDYSGDHRFHLVNRQGKITKRWAGIPSANEEALQSARPALAQAWRSFIDYNPRNGVLVAATQLGEVLEVYNLKDSTHVVCIGPEGEPRFKVSQGYGIPTGITGFSDVQVTDKAIYAIFSGCSFKEMIQNAQKGIEMPEGGRFIYVFSLQGKPLRKYVLDHYISGLSVDEERGVITATDMNVDDPVIEFRME